MFSESIRNRKKDEIGSKTTFELCVIIGKCKSCNVRIPLYFMRKKNNSNQPKMWIDPNEDVLVGNYLLSHVPFFRKIKQMDNMKETKKIIASLCPFCGATQSEREVFDMNNEIVVIRRDISLKE